VAAELHGVGGDGQIGGTAQLQRVAVGEAQGQSFKRGQSRWGGKARVEAADGQDKLRLAPPAGPERHVAGQGELQNAGVIERRIQRDGLGTHIQHTQRIHADLHERMGLAR